MTQVTGTAQEPGGAADRSGMTMTPTSPVEVTCTSEPTVLPHRQAAWSAWLHGRVAVVHQAGQARLIVPMDCPTPAAEALARRLHAVGAVTVLDD